MGIRTLQRECRSELDYAKKGVLFPPKAGLPPLIRGPYLSLFCTNSLKMAPF
jgi:hypothetical protein